MTQFYLNMLGMGEFLNFMFGQKVGKEHHMALPDGRGRHYWLATCDKLSEQEVLDTDPRSNLVRQLDQKTREVFAKRFKTEVLSQVKAFQNDIKGASQVDGASAAADNLNRLFNSICTNFLDLKAEFNVLDTDEVRISNDAMKQAVA